jgi:hypothetical protein
MTPEYKPNPEDIAWANKMLRLVKNGGVLGYPDTKLIYRIDHDAKTLTLLDSSVLYDEDGEHATTVHRRTITVFREVGYQVLVKEK